MDMGCMSSMIDPQLYKELLVQDIWVNALTLARIDNERYIRVLQDIANQLELESVH